MASLLCAGCYSASLLTTPEPTPVGVVRGTPAIGFQRATAGTDFADGNQFVPVPEGAVRTGVSEGVDVGLKAGPLYFELSSLVRLAQGESWVVSAMPGLGVSWLWERPLEDLGHAGSWRALGSVDTSTRVTSVRLPLLLGWHGPRDRFGFLVGPTVHAGYRDCRDVTKHDPSDSALGPIRTCKASDQGAVLAYGAHVGVQLSFGTFFKLMPELSILSVPIAPSAREVAIDEVRTQFSKHDVIAHFALGFQLGRFERRPRPSWLDQH